MLELNIGLQVYFHGTKSKFSFEVTIISCVVFESLQVGWFSISTYRVHGEHRTVLGVGRLYESWVLVVVS